jgi:hypothetical protein
MYIKGDFVALNETNSFGIDKLHLFSDSFSVDSITPWNIRPNNKKEGQDSIEHTPLMSVNGETVYGAAAFINRPQYTAEIKYGKLHLQFNPSKFFHDYNLTTDQDKVAHVLNSIGNDLREHLRTDTDVFTMGVSRLDLTAQAAMSKSVPYYDQVIKGSRNLKRAPKTDYPHGFLIGNKSRQLCTYDKGLKLQLDQGIKTHDNTNFMRVESRILNAKTMKGQTMFGTIADVLTATKGQINQAYSKTTNALLRIDQAPIQFIEITALTDLIKYAHNGAGRGDWLMFVIITLSEGSALPTASQFEMALVPLVHEEIISRATAWRNVRKYTEIVHKTRMVRSRYIQDTELNYADLHKEFTDTFINQYKTA